MFVPTLLSFPVIRSRKRTINGLQFYQNVVKGNYDEDGFMYMDSSEEVKSIKEVLNTGYKEVTIVQIFALLFFTIACLHKIKRDTKKYESAFNYVVSLKKSRDAK